MQIYFTRLCFVVNREIPHQRRLATHQGNLDWHQLSEDLSSLGMSNHLQCPGRSVLRCTSRFIFVTRSNVFIEWFSPVLAGCVRLALRLILRTALDAPYLEVSRQLGFPEAHVCFRGLSDIYAQALNDSTTYPFTRSQQLGSNYILPDSANFAHSQFVRIAYKFNCSVIPNSSTISVTSPI